jgi:hypothetical protein
VIRAERTTPPTTPSAPVRVAEPDVAARHHVVAPVRLDERSAGLHRLLGVGDGRQLLVVHLDRIERSVRGEPVLGDHGRHGLAHVAGAVDAQRVPLDALRPDGRGVVRLGDRARVLRDLAPGHDVEDARQTLRSGRVDRPDAGVRVRAAQHGHERHPRELDVVDERPLARDELAVRHHRDRLADVRHVTRLLAPGALSRR